ncbi:MAG: tRNA (adenosine(37)-N6)-threonylcarbamoyltransferase complex ATPase subunit type 1 TsaE [bacterium]|nr:tRNA (adenosine(37)-N6)-threonylcarbamoyltransferase complex ATPase subunit type 1 TsaE [bacterium]
MKTRSARHTEGLSRSLRDTAAIAEGTLETLSKKERRGALVIVCSGNLGSGKTAFVAALAKAFGVRERVASPTFVLMKIYELPKRAQARYGLARLVHIDAYRFDKPEELFALGFRALARDPLNLIVIEWGERVKELLPKGFAHLHFNFIDEKTRAIVHAR